MKYFLAVDTNKKRHIIVAHEIGEASRFAVEEGISTECLYELKADTFNEVGFLISDRQLPAVTESYLQLSTGFVFCTID